MGPRDLLAWNVKKLRVARGLSQEHLALEAGLERAAISNIERKRVSIGLDLVGQIACTLNVPLQDLFIEPRPGEPEPVNLKRGRRASKAE
ncbi:helix-turn-helix domain-containing protein [Rhizobium sp. VS19-DR104.2]|uniref:helix-turn-helix transcriptional regulator n=1 Tax=unclassified Rhizobium TaxID=2613769 RepID=UPI001CC351E5|nr:MULTISPECIES: helix-turn-helix transcriptional regulator [unclassified Rhizobium]MBZ5762277.1 helix-turn-helix domain-containing protein [Rhizobium sp. VS19-DR96]MBZ5768293.1 helix-turn-helix domain-containing protein [Rhizobium sp. VS19-DR129.2]MBZ5775835.1 helix-turn-helix domain-containing protein [Rhizobium sp. VS19-DRK62.2]MBZ5787144.1 helix-turn-helix domain-containing protein [Rhizobium sp. VS19-DR121]MBZ5804219.1 helix-turn-helix domain-containing protein [Rhizobium sp. VS19-DR181]